MCMPSTLIDGINVVEGRPIKLMGNHMVVHNLDGNGLDVDIVYDTTSIVHMVSQFDQ